MKNIRQWFTIELLMAQEREHICYLTQTGRFLGAERGS